MMPKDKAWEALAIDVWRYVWNQPSKLFFQGALIVPLVGWIGLNIILILASIVDVLFKLCLFYGAAVLVLGIMRWLTPRHPSTWDRRRH